jgi:uncharacterized protein (TIGR02001 family)
MKHKIGSSLFLATVLASSLASAQTAAPAAPAAPEPDYTLSYNVGVVSDYRYRGISQSRMDPAAQGGIDFVAKNGFYLGTWASTIHWIKDAGGKDDVEWDLYGGYKGEIAKDLTYDVGFMRYEYVGNKLAAVSGWADANTDEIYGALTYGVVTAKYSHSLSNLFGAIGSKNSGYLELAASFDVGSGVTLAPHIGHQKVAGSGNGIYSYTDYSIAATKDYGNGLALSATLTGTDAIKTSYATPEGKFNGKTGLQLGLKYSF